MQQSQQELYLKNLDKFLQEQTDLVVNITELIKQKDVDLHEYKQQLLEILQLDFKGQKLLYTAQARISNELKEFYSKGLTHIKVYQLKVEDNILNHILIIIMKGKIDTLYEGGNYSFLLKFPENFPYAAPSFRSLIPLKHPHIYPNMRLCTPTINESYAIQQYSLLELLQSWYSILHREPNVLSLANSQAYEEYKEEFIKLQAVFNSDENPILKLFKIQQHEEDELELFMSF
ncbi:unnamed protein product [Paramecium sonneborni]|uniref:UBC core domain-containing protein n=1 Tax=Paramecium sonneborni TaxID=65129 RepID=A0A8S1PHN6_9CILI|nr:unnamed protein product [Paramecium sonneborni]